MNTDTLQALECLLKASKQAHRLRSSLDMLLRLLPNAHKTWHTAARETRHIELRLEAIHAVFEEMVQRDPALCAALLLLPEEGDTGELSRHFDASEITET